VKRLGISGVFRNIIKEGRKAFIPYIMAGDPDLEKTLDYVLMLEKCGADMVELGIPFSDPLADGPTIQRAAERALKKGVTLNKVLAFVRELRSKTSIPVILMTYYNPVFKYGERRFAEDAGACGVDGLIVPDLPPEEAGNLAPLCREAGVDTIFLVAPTSGQDRMKKVAKASRGFVYYVSMTGITGARLSLNDDFSAHIGRLRQLTRMPVAVGFGVSTPEDAHMISRVADGVIIGSAIVGKLQESPETARDFISRLREAIG
jgi:tryptophan synthase alpha chain